MAMASSHGGADEPDVLERRLQDFASVLREKLRLRSLAPLKLFEVAKLLGVCGGDGFVSNAEIPRGE